MFLLAQTPPNYEYLAQKQHIRNISELKTKLTNAVEKVDLLLKSKDFEHLLFNKANKERVLYFKEFIANF